MRSYQREGTQPETALEALRESYANSGLAKLVSSFVGTKPPVPEDVDRFVGEVAARAVAVRDLGPARLIGCADPELAAFIAGHPAAGKLCSLAGRDKLVVAARDQASFLRALRKLGFVLRQPPAEI
jgi:hypothetical protein